MKFSNLVKTALVSVCALGLVACGSNKSTGESGSKEDKTITIVASPVPHAEILDEAKKLLADKGYTLDVRVVNDYVTPNQIVYEGDADANFFQHTPYLNTFNKEHNYNLVSVGNVHIEPMAVYSKKYKSLAELPENAVVYASTSPSDVGRFLSFFVDAGLMTLKPGTDVVSATLDDIATNPKNIQIKTEIAPEFLVQTFNNNEGDAVIINSNFAIDAHLSPTKDSIALESSSSPYANLVAVTPKNKDSEKIKALMEVLQGKEIKEFIEKTYTDGAVVPVN